jgi:hypothetical protein
MINAPQMANPVIWTHEEHTADKSNPWKLSRFAQELNRLDEFLKSTLPPTGIDTICYFYNQ